GQWEGGYQTLRLMDNDSLAAQSFPARFRAAIAYYSYCDLPGLKMKGPTLILIGAADETSPAERCRQMIAHAQSDGAPITLIVYPGVQHNFDVALLPPGVRYRGYWHEYNEPATKDAEEKTRAFLAAQSR